MNRVSRRVALTLTLATGALCGAAPSALAARVKVDPIISQASEGLPIGHQMSFIADQGEANAVTVTDVAGVVTIRDAVAPVVAPIGCQQVDPRAVTCRPSSGPIKVVVALGDNDDSLSLNTAADGTIVDGGPGNDVLVGGPGDDSLDGDIGNDLIAGGAGDDLLEPGLGGDVLHGGEGSDSAVYTARELPVSIDLSLPRADGATDAADSLTSVEGAIGGNGKDVLTGNDGPNRLEGNIGNDRITGRGGADELIGSEGADQIDAGAGDDLIDLSNVVEEDEGEDGEFTVDESNDRVRCGSGFDRVLLPEVGDRLADCELAEFAFIVLRTSSVRVTRRHVTVRVSEVNKGPRQRIWITIKRGGRTSLLGRSEPRKRAGTARIRLNSNGLKLFRDGREHKIRLGDDFDPDAGITATVGR